MTRRQYYAFWTVMAVCIVGGAVVLFTPVAFELGWVLPLIGSVVLVYAYRKGWVRS